MAVVENVNFGVSASENRVDFMKEGFCCFYVKFYDKQDEQEFLDIMKAYTKANDSFGYNKESESVYKVFDIGLVRTDSYDTPGTWDGIELSLFMGSKWGMLFRKYASMAKQVRMSSNSKEKYYPIRFGATQIPAGLGKRIAA